MRKIRGVLLFLILITSYTNAAHLVLKDGKAGNIIVIDTAAMYNPNMSSFKIGVLKGTCYLQKNDVKLLTVNFDTLYFSDNVTHVVHTAKIADSLTDESTQDNLHKYSVDSVTGRAYDELSESLAYGRGLARKGTAMVCAGYGLNLGVALPVSVISIVKVIISSTIFGDSTDHSGERGLYFSLVANRVAKGLMFTGAFCSGAGASLAYKIGRQYDNRMESNINWKFYRTGIIAEGASNTLLLSELFILPKNKPDIVEELIYSGIIVLGAISDGMFLASAINASYYTRAAAEANQKRKIEINIHPSVSYSNKSAGLILDISL